MSIEVANESGMDVDETILIDVAAYVMQRMDCLLYTSPSPRD